MLDCHMLQPDQKFIISDSIFFFFAFRMFLINTIFTNLVKKYVYQRNASRKNRIRTFRIIICKKTFYFQSLKSQLSPLFKDANTINDQNMTEISKIFHLSPGTMFNHLKEKLFESAVLRTKL